MTRPRLLDLFCGAGGAAVGYHRAGFDVVGVDIAPQPHYPFEFVQTDALAVLRGEWHSLESVTDISLFDAVHASPPCQAYSVTRFTHSKKHPDLMAAVRTLLEHVGLPWVIENVVGAPMRWSVDLCGSMFGLQAEDTDGERLELRRHRRFESSFLMFQPACQHSHLTVGGVYGGGPENRQKRNWKNFGRRAGGYTPAQSVRAELMGIDWMSRDELTQAIPPAYTEWVGHRLLRVVIARKKELAELLAEDEEVRV